MLNSPFLPLAMLMLSSLLSVSMMPPTELNLSVSFPTVACFLAGDGGAFVKLEFGLSIWPLD